MKQKAPQLPNLTEIYMNMAVQAAEPFIIREVEKIEGRVPSNKEIDRYNVWSPNEKGEIIWLWRGKPIVRVRPGPGKFIVATMKGKAGP